MALRLVQPGSGAKRPLVIVYHAGTWSDLLITTAAGPDACVVNDTEAPSKGLYASLDAGGIDSLPIAVAAAQELVGEVFQPSPLVVAGFSEGCEGVRSQLLTGHAMDVAVCADGIQVPRNYTAGDLKVWKDLVSAARSGSKRFLASHAFYTATNGLPVVETMRLITGFPLPEGGTGATPIVSRDGGLVVYSAATGHPEQGQVLLPMMIDEAVHGSATSWPSVVLGIASVIVGFFAARSIIFSQGGRR